MNFFKNLNLEKTLKLTNYILVGLISAFAIYLLVFFVAQKTDFISKSSKTDAAEVVEEKVDPTILQENANHNIAADEYAYSTEQVRNYITGQETTDQKLVFLTFDDGISPGFTDRVLDILQSYGVHGTFFLIGNYLQSQDQEMITNIINRQISEGHAIGLHTMSHDMGLLYPGRTPNPDQIVAEAAQQQEVIKEYLGAGFHTNVFRYPGGHMSWSGLEGTDDRLANELGLQWIDWNKSVGDAEPANRRPNTLEEMIAFHENSSKDFPESTVKVVLMHDTYGKDLTVEALPQVIEYYQNEGYTFGILE